MAMVLLTLSIAIGATPAGAQGYDSGAEAEFVASINQLRASKGLALLTVDNELLGPSRSWADTMKAQGHISHAPDLSVGVTQNWQKLGENVGVGPTVGSLMDAFIASPGHYANLVDPAYTRVAVGVVWAGNVMYTTHRFMALQAAAPTPAAAPAPSDPPAAAAPPPVLPAADPAPEPAPTTAPPTTPPPTTTTLPPPPASPSSIDAMLDALAAVGA